MKKNKKSKKYLHTLLRNITRFKIDSLQIQHETRKIEGSFNSSMLPLNVYMTLAIIGLRHFLSAGQKSLSWTFVAS
jgi:hypothetical protein